MAKKPTITIQSGIPIPVVGHQGKWKSIMMQMKAGDSFAIPNGTLNSVRGCVSYLNKRLPKQEWVVKKVDHETYRCWRVK